MVKGAEESIHFTQATWNHIPVQAGSEIPSHSPPDWGPIAKYSRRMRYCPSGSWQGHLGEGLLLREIGITVVCSLYGMGGSQHTPPEMQVL